MGAGPLLASNLVSASGPGQNLSYDTHGDITALADQAMSYDQTGRHTGTTTTGGGGATVTYTRDATDQIVSMSTTVGSTTTSVNYGYTGTGLRFTLNAAKTALNETTLSLPGGVTESIQATGSVWSYPDLHGDDTVTTDGSGVRVGSIAIYDPFGDPINLTTGLIGTLTANSQTLGNTSTPTANYGWVGSALKQTQTSGDIATIEMGARQYLPELGRFLSVDPVSGGNANDYNYPNDPVNGSDLTGKMMATIYLGGNAFAAGPAHSSTSHPWDPRCLRGEGCGGLRAVARREKVGLLQGRATARLRLRRTGRKRPKALRTLWVRLASTAGYVRSSVSSS